MANLFKRYSDLIQFGIFVLTGIALLSGFFGFCLSYFAKASDVNQMQVEIHQIYGKLIPEAERSHGP